MSSADSLEILSGFGPGRGMLAGCGGSGRTDRGKSADSRGEGWARPTGDGRPPGSVGDHIFVVGHGVGVVTGFVGPRLRSGPNRRFAGWVMPDSDMSEDFLHDGRIVNHGDHTPACAAPLCPGGTEEFAEGAFAASARVWWKMLIPRTMRPDFARSAISEAVRTEVSARG